MDETTIAIQIELTYAPAARRCWEACLTVPSGSRLLHALQVSGLLAQNPELSLASIAVGVWGRKVGLDHVLRDRDRLEVYRPLIVDPKVARRERFRRQGARTAGLFSRKKAGNQAGTT